MMLKIFLILALTAIAYVACRKPLRSVAFFRVPPAPSAEEETERCGC